MSWGWGGGYVHKNAQQADAMAWPGKVVRPAGSMYKGEAAEALGVSMRTLERMMERGDLTGHPSPAGGGVVLLREAEVSALAVQRMVARGMRA